MENHNHNGLNSPKLKTYDIIPTYKMTATQLTQYLSRPAINGEEFNVYDSTNDKYYKYYYLDQWNKLEAGDLMGCVASDNLKTSADNTVTQSGASINIVKSIKVFRSGTIRVSVEWQRNAGYSSTGNFCINGTIVGDALTDATSYTKTTRDLTVSINDLVQVQINTGQPSSIASVKNFRIYYDTTPLADQVILN